MKEVTSFKEIVSFDLGKEGGDSVGVVYPRIIVDGVYDSKNKIDLSKYINPDRFHLVSLLRPVKDGVVKVLDSSLIATTVIDEVMSGVNKSNKNGMSNISILNIMNSLNRHNGTSSGLYPVIDCICNTIRGLLSLSKGADSDRLAISNRAFLSKDGRSRSIHMMDSNILTPSENLDYYINTILNIMSGVYLEVVTNPSFVLDDLILDCVDCIVITSYVMMFCNIETSKETV